jgi:RHS repeat-associated protein
MSGHTHQDLREYGDADEGEGAREQPDAGTESGAAVGKAGRPRHSTSFHDAPSFPIGRVGGLRHLSLRGPPTLKLAGLWLAAVLVLGMALAGNAAAAPLWLVCLEGSGLTKYSTNQCTTASSTGKWQSLGLPSGKSDTVRLLAFSLRLEDTSVGVSIECPDAGTGWGLIESPNKSQIKVAEVKEPEKEGCKVLKGFFTCKAGTLTNVKGLNLPWKTEIFETEKKNLTKILSGGGGEPGWAVTCGGTTDECITESGGSESAELVNEVTSSVLLVSARFEATGKNKCSVGGKETGKTHGSIAILLWSGNGLSVNLGGSGGGAEPTTLTTSLSGEGKEGETITVLEGSKVKDKATLSGKNASTATGTVTYRVYSDSKCEHEVTKAGEVTVTSGSVPASSEEELEGGKSYYWQASYSGDSKNSASTSVCGAEISTVKRVPTALEDRGEGNAASIDIGHGCVGGSINCATGNLAGTQTDISIGGRGPGLRVERTYNSLGAAEAKEAGAWGYGWTGPYSAHLEVSSKPETATVYQNNGSDVVFYKESGKYVPSSWIQATLVESGSDYIYTLPDQTKLDFNSEDRLTKETERDGNSITLTYNGSHQLEKATDGDSRTLTFAYNGEGQVESVTDPMSHVVSYTYSSKNLASVTIEGKIRWEFKYNSEHQLTTLTDGLKDSTTDEYDASHRLIKQVRAGHERKLKYGSTPGAETTLTEPDGSETLEVFNRAGEPTKITRAKGVSGVETTTEYIYNSSYELEKLIDPASHETKYGYDSEGNKTSETDPSGDERKWTYDKKHDVETETSPEGEKTTIKLNSDGEPEVVERSVGSEVQKTQYAYDADGDLEEETNPLGKTTKYKYDAAGDRESEKDPESDERTWKYNEDSQKIEETDPRGHTTKTERNEQGQPIKITDPLGHTTEYKYDGDGDVESETDGNRHTTKYVYNEENLPTKVEEPDGDHPENEYDSEGEMVSHTDGNGHTWEYKRNKLEEVTEEVNPLGKKTKKTYEKTGSLKTIEDAEGHTTTYKYDESGRLKEIEYSTGTPSKVTSEYNKDGQVTKLTDETGTTTNTYDKLDRLTESKNGAGKTVKYEYNLDDEPTKVTYPNGKAVTREYDNDARLEKVTDWNGNETGFSYNSDSELAATTFPTATEDEDKYTYNEADQMTEVKLTKGAATLGTLAYARDNDGQLKKTTATVLPGEKEVEDTYNGANRLTKAGSIEYEYDKANNLTKSGGDTYTYNAADELETGTEKSIGIEYAYDEDGQHTKTKPSSGPATTYGYDQTGNLTTDERPEEPTEKIIKTENSYTYNGDNLRASQDINGTTTNLTWDTAEELPPILSDETNSYIYGPENLPIEQISSGGAVLYIHHDQQGSTRLLTNTTGETEAAYTYNPYGLLTNKTGTATTPLLYDGQYTTNPDTSTELIYLRARELDPTTAPQFLTVDPQAATTGEPYTYAGDNPLNADDPGGLNSHGGCGHVGGNFGPVEGGLSLCVVTSNRDTGITFTPAGGVGADRNIIQNIVQWIRNQGPAGVTQLLAGSGGAGYQTSNAQEVCQLAGWSRYTRASLGFWLSGSVEYFRTNNGIRGTTYSLSYTGPRVNINPGGGDGASYTFAYSFARGLCP